MRTNPLYKQRRRRREYQRGPLSLTIFFLFVGIIAIANLLHAPSSSSSPSSGASSHKISLLHPKDVDQIDVTCDSESTHAHCSFHRAVCFYVPTREWIADEHPFPNWGGVSRSTTHLGRKPFDSCDEPFLPRSVGRKAFENILREQADRIAIHHRPVILLCVWLHQFGHSLLDFLYPAFELWKTFQTDDEDLVIFSDFDEMAVVGDPWVTYQSLELLGKVANFRWVVHQLQQRNNVDYFCFDRLLVGLKRHGVYDSADVPENGHRHFRNYILQKIGMPESSQSMDGTDTQGADNALTTCRAVYVQRTEKRRLLNEADVVETIQRTLGTSCTVESVDFNRNMTLIDQIRYVSSATWLISLAGSGSHQMLWLPDGAVSLVILHPFHHDKDVNKVICDHMTTILCLQSESVVPDGVDVPEDPMARKNVDVNAKLSELEAAIVRGMQRRTSPTTTAIATGGGSN